MPDAEDTCSQCGEPNDDGEGWDGLCGNCADKVEDALEEDDIPAEVMEAISILGRYFGKISIYAPEDEDDVVAITFSNDDDFLIHIDAYERYTG